MFSTWEPLVHITASESKVHSENSRPSPGPQSGSETAPQIDSDVDDIHAADYSATGASANASGMSAVWQANNAFYANLRHELRTPINAILGYSEMLLEDLPPETSQGSPATQSAQSADSETTVAKKLRQIHHAGDKLLALVHDRLQGGPTAGDGDLATIESCVSQLRLEMQRPLEQVIACGQSLLAEPELEQQVIDDLQKIIKAGNKLATIVDQGVCVIHGTLHLTDSSVTAAASASTSSDPMSPLLASQHGDGFDSLVLSKAQHSIETGTILLVDDSESNRDVLCRRLRRQGHIVSTADDGLKALDMLENGKFDLVLLDIKMPEMDGIHVLQHMRSQSSMRHIPVIMISALDELDSVVRCLEMGAEDYLPKPFNATILQARIGACMEKKRLRDREILYLQRIEAEKQRADDLLHVILPAPIVEELKSNNAVKPRRHENVAVLFTDIVGFTPYSDKRQPEEIVACLQKLIEAYESFAAEEQMLKIKTIGDAFMAVANLLTPVENPVLSCIRCGLRMIEAANNLESSWRVRVGVHIGPVVAGVLGRRQYQYDLWGDTVNTAARMESHGTPNRISLSDTAWKWVEDRCEGESLGMLQVKGKGSLGIVLFNSFK